MKIRTNKMKLLLLTTFAASMLVAGCGNQNKETASSESPSDSGQATSSQSASESTAPVEKQKLILWHTVTEKYDQEWWKKWVDEYNKSQDNIQVELTFIPGDAWDQKLKAAQATGTAPDIYNKPLSGVAQEALKGTIMPLDDYVNPDVWNDLTENGKKYMFLNGKYYGFPRYIEPSALLLYRKDKFAEAGLDPEKPPTTWDELIEYGKKLTNKGVFGINMPTGEGDMSWTTWGMQSQLNGHLALADDWSKATIATDGNVELLNFFKRVFDEKIAPKQAIDGYANDKPIAQGKVAMEMAGSWTLGALANEFPDQMDKIGVSFFPTKDGDYKKPTASLGGWALVVDAKSQHPKESAEFLQWMFARDPKVLADYYQRGKYSKFSPWKSVEDYLIQDPEAAKAPYRKIIAEQVVPYAVNEPLYPWDVSVAFGQAFNRVLLNNMDPMKSLQQSEKQINDFIAKNQLAGKNFK